MLQDGLICLPIYLMLNIAHKCQLGAMPAQRMATLQNWKTSYLSAPWPHRSQNKIKIRLNYISGNYNLLRVGGIQDTSTTKWDDLIWIIRKHISSPDNINKVTSGHTKERSFLAHHSGKFYFLHLDDLFHPMKYVLLHALSPIIISPVVSCSQGRPHVDLWRGEERPSLGRKLK